MARRTAAAPELFEATTSVASEWIEQNATDDFPGGVVRQGTIVGADHPILKAHAQWFQPLRSDVGEGSPPRHKLAGR